MTSRRLDLRAAAVSTLLVVLGPAMVVVGAGLRGGWMLRGRLGTGPGADSAIPLWPLDRWLLDPAIMAAIAGTFVVIALVDLRGGFEGAGFHGAVRLTPVAFLLPAGAVLFADPVLPGWLAWRATTWGTAMEPMQLHNVVLELARPGAFVGILASALLVAQAVHDGVPAWREGASSVALMALKAVVVFVTGFMAAAVVALPPFGLLLGPWARGPAMALVLLPSLFVSVCLWHWGWLRPSAHPAATYLPTAITLGVLGLLALVAAVGEVGVLHAAGLASY